MAGVLAIETPGRPGSGAKAYAAGGRCPGSFMTSFSASHCRTALQIGFVLLASTFAACGLIETSSRDPATPEMLAIKELTQTQNAEARAHVETGHYLRLGELRQLYPALLATQPGSIARSGYAFTLDVEETGYQLRAIPLPGRGGRRSFYCDETTVIRESWGPGLASARSRELQ